MPQNPNPRLSPKQLADLLLQREQQMPIILSETEFRKHIDHTILHRQTQAEVIIDDVCSKLQEIASRLSGKPDQKELNETVERLNDAIGAFQHAMTWKNCAGAGGLTVGKHVILWPKSEGSKGE
jgi:hypothetical protein